MAKYVYPAIFSAEDEGGYSVHFPDIEGCFTCGDDIVDSLVMAEDVLALVLYEFEKENKGFPTVSKIENLNLGTHQFATYVLCDTGYYKRMYSNKSVKKTLTIPEWMNEEAELKNINFSKVLQEALGERLKK